MSLIIKKILFTYYFGNIIINYYIKSNFINRVKVKVWFHFMNKFFRNYTSIIFYLLITMYLIFQSYRKITHLFYLIISEIIKICYFKNTDIKKTSDLPLSRLINLQLFWTKSFFIY